MNLPPQEIHTVTAVAKKGVNRLMFTGSSLSLPKGIAKLKTAEGSNLNRFHHVGWQVGRKM
jgi:hypothetical protein